MRSIAFLLVSVFLASVSRSPGGKTPPLTNSAHPLVLLEKHTSAEDLGFLNGEPFLLVGVRPNGGVHQLQLRDKQGRVIWTHQLGEGEKLGQARLSPDGKHLLYDYFVLETGKDWLTPHERVSYRGGIRCVRRDGSIAWERPSRGISEGGPTGSPEGTVEQVAGNKVLILRYGWECVKQVTVRDLLGRQVWQIDLQGATAAVLSPDGSYLVISGQTGAPDKVWTRVIKSDRRIVLHVVGARLPVDGAPGWSHLNISYLLLEVFSARNLFRTLGREDQPSSVQEVSETGCALITTEGKLAWLGRWAFDAGEEPTPTLQDEAKDVSWYINNWKDYHLLLGQRGKEIAVLWNMGSRRRLLILDAPERGRGTLALQRVTALPTVRRGESNILSPDGKLVAIYRVSRDGNAGMLHVHFWDQRGRFLGEASVRGLPLSESGLPGYPARVWITPDNRYAAVWLRFSAHEACGYCVIQVPGEA